MKCRRCGAVLRKEGDLCPKCHKAMLEEEELKNDVKALLTVKRKYKPGFHLKQRIDVMFIIFLVVGSLFSAGHFFVGILSLAVGIGIILAYLAIQKIYALNEKVVFYEKKVVKYSSVPIIGVDKEIPYKNISDIAYYQQSLRQKKANIGDLVIYVKYTGFFGGIRLNNVENGNEIIQEIIDRIPIVVEEE